MGPNPLVLPSWHITTRLPFEEGAEGLYFFVSSVKPSLLYHGNQTIFHSSRQLESPLVGVLQFAESIPTSMQLSFGSPLGLGNYLLFDI